MQNCWGRRSEVRLRLKVVCRQQFLGRRWPPFRPGFNHGDRFATLHSGHYASHSFAPSSHAEVMEAFPPEDHASGLHNLDFNKGPVPMQRSLGVYWYLKSDSFTFQVLLEEKPFTRRWVLSVNKNSLMIPWALQHQSSLTENTYSDHWAWNLAPHTPVSGTTLYLQKGKQYGKNGVILFEL